MPFLKIMTLYTIGNSNGTYPQVIISTLPHLTSPHRTSPYLTLYNNHTPLHVPSKHTEESPNEKKQKKTATTVELFIYGTAEPAAAIMAASIPALRALVQQETRREPAKFVELSEKQLGSPSLLSSSSNSHSLSFRSADT